MQEAASDSELYAKGLYRRKRLGERLGSSRQSIVRHERERQIDVWWPTKVGLVMLRAHCLYTLPELFGWNQAGSSLGTQLASWCCCSCHSLCGMCGDPPLSLRQLQQTLTLPDTATGQLTHPTTDIETETASRTWQTRRPRCARLAVSS